MCKSFSKIIITKRSEGGFLLDYITIDFTPSVQKQSKEINSESSRKIKAIERTKFQYDLKQKLANMADINNLEEPYDNFISAIESTINLHAPKQKTIIEGRTSLGLTKRHLSLGLSIKILKEDG